MSCLHLPWLLCSCVLLCRMLGLPCAFFGPLPGHFEAPGGSWGSRALLGLSRAAPGQPLGRSWGTLGAPWGHSWRLLGLSWPALGLLPASLGPSWRLLGPPLGRLGRLLAAESEFSRNPVKTVSFSWFLHDFGPSGGLLAPSWRLLGGSWAVLSGLGWLLGGSWAVLSGPGCFLGALVSSLGPKTPKAPAKAPKTRTQTLY